jgi:rhamnogalacturonan endolyase
MATRKGHMAAAMAVVAGVLVVLSLTVSPGYAQAAVSLRENDQLYILVNGIVVASVAKASGDLVSLRYKGLEMLATFLKEDGTPDLEKDPPGENRAGLNRGMTDHQYGFWSHDAMGPRGTGDAAARITVDPRANGGERAEVSVKGVSNGRLMGTGPGAGAQGNFIADIEIRWALGRGDSGVYTYCAFEHKADYAASSITEARFCAKLADFFDWMSIAQDEHHDKHYPASLREGDKYIYTTNQYDNPAFGWSSTTKGVGFFIINPSMEYMSGGPTKIEFLGHRDTNQVAAPCVLNYWRSSHYGGAEVAVAAGEHWTKVIGPFMLYVNSGSGSQAIYEDARNQAVKEQQKWPFAWVSAVDYATPSQRATVKGQLVLSDPLMPAARMSRVMVGLTVPAYTSSAPGFGGAARIVDWQQDAKHYQFWVRATDAGEFVIPNVSAGTYTLRAFADGVLGEYTRADVTVEAGKALDLGKMAWTPVRRGRQLWEVGIPNRSGSEFFKGDVYYTPNITASYGELFPNDIVYVIDKSDFAKDWFFAHVPHVDPSATPPAQTTRFGFPATPNGRATPRTVVFDMPANGRGKATLRLAFSGTGVRSIAVVVNDEAVGQLSNLPNDGVLSNHGMHGIWHEKEFAFDAALLKQGTNKLTLTVPGGNANSGVIYDYLRLELEEPAPPSTPPAFGGRRGITGPQIRVTADHADWNYVPGEAVKFTVTGPAGTTVNYTIGPEMLPAEPKSAVIPADGVLVLDGGTMKGPGFLRCVATAVGGGRDLATAGFSPEKIKPIQTEPADFDAFWARAKAELATIPMDARLTPLPQHTNDEFEAFEVNLQNIGTPPAPTSRFYGVLCIPRGEGPFPAIMSGPGAGVYPPGPETVWARRGFITLSVGVHELPVVQTPGAAPAVRPPGTYPMIGLDDPNHYYFRRVFMGLLRANDYLVTHPKWDRKNLIAAGGSQGGFLAIVTAALDPRVTACRVSFPAYCDVIAYMHGRPGGWPASWFKFESMNDPAREAMIATTAYYDGVNFAKRIKVPGHYGWGYNDDTCPPDSTFAAYNVITAPKQLAIIKEMGHPKVDAMRELEDAWLLRQVGKGR